MEFRVTKTLRISKGPISITKVSNRESLTPTVFLGRRPSSVLI